MEQNECTSDFTQNPTFQKIKSKNMNPIYLT